MDNNIPTCDLTGCVIGYYTPFHLLKPTTYISAVIRIFAKVKYSHVSNVVDNRHNEIGGIEIHESIIDKNNNGYVSRSFEESIKGCNIIILKPKYAGFDVSKFTQRTYKLLNKTPYDIHALIYDELLLNVTGSSAAIDEFKAEKSNKAICYKTVYFCHQEASVCRNWGIPLPKLLWSKEASQEFEIIYKS